MLSINTNVASLSAQRNVAGSQSAMAQSVQRLSSGLRVNSAKDDAAGLAIATRLDSQARGFTVAQRNANDGISLLQITDGSLSAATDHLQRMRELAVQASNGTNGAADLTNLQTEFAQLAGEVTAVIGSASFNGNSLTAGATVNIQVGANSGDTRALTITATNALTSLAGDISAAGGAAAALTAIDADFTTVNTARAEVGANLSKFDKIVADLSVKIENTQTAKGRIMDADYASETAKLSKNQILQQAGVAMLAQANQMPQSVMSLLRG